MGQQNSLSIPVLKNNTAISFNPELHQFQSEYVQRVKETPFAGSVLFSSQPILYVEPAETTMEILVAPRLNTNKLFPKQEILKIIDNVLNALAQLQLKNFQNYGNISLSTIFYHKQTKLFKLINPAFFNSNNFLMAKEAVRFSFLAPEELLNLSTEEQRLNCSFKTDIFILGICMLQICTLTDSRQIYCPETYNIFDIQIRSRLKSVEEFYSSDLANFLQICLVYQNEKRIDLENAIKEIKFLRQKDKGQIPKQQQPIQLNTLTPALSPRGEPKKATLPFGPGHLPKKLLTSPRDESY